MNKKFWKRTSESTFLIKYYNKNGFDIRVVKDTTIKEEYYMVILKGITIYSSHDKSACIYVYKDEILKHLDVVDMIKDSIKEGKKCLRIN